MFRNLFYYLAFFMNLLENVNKIKINYNFICYWVCISICEMDVF
ncbi:hypothetical protein SAMN04487893_103175 [Myroides guanonis]|uniref:Uncharacterized protein n=1 Tax=Myroides guanonis TaxID=1150112 RepID=A0A1I3NR79_9FLAO|nr:hypothetical protein SAMN04487893_103175 [Myroides guanonis]